MTLQVTPDGPAETVADSLRVRQRPEFVESSVSDSTIPQAVPTARGAEHGESGHVEAEEAAQRTFSLSVLISAIRCTLTYLVFPFVAPIVGIASGVGSTIGVVTSVIGIASNLWSIQRFHASQHRWRWHITAINVAIIVLLTVLLVLDLGDLV